MKTSGTTFAILIAAAICVFLGGGTAHARISWVEACLIEGNDDSTTNEYVRCCYDKERECDNRCYALYGPEEEGGSVPGTLLNCYNACRNARNECIDGFNPDFLQIQRELEEDLRQYLPEAVVE